MLAYGAADRLSFTYTHEGGLFSGNLASFLSLQGLLDVIDHMLDTKPTEMMIQYGCPLNNLAQEMSPLDEGFRQRLDHVFHLWHTVISEALKQAQARNIIRADVDCEDTATFIMAAMEGCIGLAKTAQSVERLKACNRGLIQYLLSLKV